LTVRGEITIDVTPEEFINTIHDFDQVYNFDQYLESHKLIEDIGEGMYITELVFKKLLVISRRETLSIIKRFSFDNGIVIMSAVSTEHPECPLKKEPVRATIYCAGWIAVPVDSNKTRAIYINSANPNGDIPNRFKPKAAYTAAGMPKLVKQYIDKRDKKKK